MIYAKAQKIYVPVFYILLQNKLENTYILALQSVIAACNWKIEPHSFTCDFETGLLNALQQQFPDAKQVLCLFHWKQAIRRKLIKLGIPKNMISNLVDENGLLNLLTVIPKEEIVEKGIPYIRHNFEEGQYEKQFDIFWNKYFIDVWVSRFDPSCWNVNEIVKNNSKEDILINRTNNPLERYNRTLNEAFSVAHPNMMQFVETLQNHANKYNNDLELIRTRKLRAPKHQEPNIHPIPDEYLAFQVPKMNNKKK
jgi:hypothetical protein